MKKMSYFLILVLIYVSSIASCSSLGQISVSDNKEAIEISVVNHIIAGIVLSVKLPPPKYVVANKIYPLELYEKGKLRARAKISWSQPELNVNFKKEILFPLTVEEQRVYIGKDLSNIFSVEIGKLPLP